MALAILNINQLKVPADQRLTPPLRAKTETLAALAPAPWQSRPRSPAGRFSKSRGCGSGRGSRPSSGSGSQTGSKSTHWSRTPPPSRKAAGRRRSPSAGAKGSVSSSHSCDNLSYNALAEQGSIYFFYHAQRISMKAADITHT